MRCILLLLPLTLLAETTAFYLSWQDDPTTTMDVYWHTPTYDPRFDAENATSNTLYFATEDTAWQIAEADALQIENTVVHRAHLSNLAPNTIYNVSIEGDTSVYRFRTAPATLEKPLCFLVGADMYASTKRFRRMSKTAMELEPLFAVLGGHLSNARTLRPFGKKLSRWSAFFKDWQTHMVDSDNCILPFLPVVSPENEMLLTLFRQNTTSYYHSLSFGSYLSLLFLDTDHNDPIEGKQTHWLSQTLTSLTTPYRFAFYHEPAYPSTIQTSTSLSHKILSHWSPLFEKHNLTASFESHSDAFKRTHPLKKGQIDPTGVTYIGDGGWGAIAKKAHSPWYLASRSHKNALLLVRLTPESAHFEALDIQNQIIDSIPLKTNILQ